LPSSFGIPQILHIQYITFNVVDMLYPYNAIFGQGLLNTFEVALHLGYHCLKIPATFGIISVFGSQKEAGNIEHGFTPGHKNVHFLWEETEQYEQAVYPPKQEASTKFKKAIEAKGEFMKVALDPRVPNRAICLGTEMSPQEQAELLEFLDQNSNDFTWSTSNLMGVSREIIE
jgi:hypothetical protein